MAPDPDALPGYLDVDDPYLERAYLAEDVCTSTGFQINRILGQNFGFQANQVNYNTDRLRVLCTFQSRGTTDGDNWTVVSGGTAAGDFGPSNLNTDIQEQVYRSTGTAVILDCDTEIAQGVSPDTFALLNTNLTSGAVVTIQADSDPGFGSAVLIATVDITTNNSFYIVPTVDFPLTQLRYWRISITDTTNTDGYIELGNILFGASIIFSRCIVDKLERSKIHFKDEVATEGFTSICNDRALKKKLQFEFKDLLFNSGDFDRLDQIFDTARTCLKCLWIPTPVNPPPQRFAMFGKLPTIPSEKHNVKGNANEDLDFVSYRIIVDESK